MTGRSSWVVPAELGGQRLDLVLARLGEVSRAVARGAIDDGAVDVDGQRRSPSSRLVPGAVITARLPARSDGVVATDVPFTVRYQDNEVIVVDKPAGLVVHPGAGHRDDTLLNGLVGAYPELLAMGEANRFGIVHRLDKETSGLLVVARSAVAHEHLQRQLKERRVTRRYLALTGGRPSADSGTIDAPIGRDSRRPTRMALSQDGRPSRTSYTVIAAWEDNALLDVRLETGRTHQIRVHLSSIGTPLTGDGTYGLQGGPADPGRVWLHAGLLGFTHPVDENKVVCVTPLPPDLTASLNRLGPSASGVIPGGEPTEVLWPYGPSQQQA